jgi:hypothetical protein
MKVHWIDKIDVVNKQVKEAVRLFFEQRDIVVIYTIVASAHQILFDLCKKKDIGGAIKKTEALRGKDVQRFLKSINYPYNYFKHADKDADKKINIGPLEQLTADLIMDAIFMFQQLSGNLPIEAKVYWHWFVSKYPQDFDNLPEDSEIRKMQSSNIGKWDFPTICKFLLFMDIIPENGSLASCPTVKLTKK